MFYVRANIPSKLLSTEPLPMEGFYVKLNLQKKKWLLCYSCNPKKNAIKSHLEILHKQLYVHLNMKTSSFQVISAQAWSVFCDTYDLKCFIKEPACNKIPENPSWIDLILTNNPKCFQNPCVVETGLSDFHSMTVTVMKTTFKKFQPRIIHQGL